MIIKYNKWKVAKVKDKVRAKARVRAKDKVRAKVKAKVKDKVRAKVKDLPRVK